MGTFLRNRYFTTVGPSSVGIVADRHRLAVIITSTADELSVGTNIVNSVFAGKYVSQNETWMFAFLYFFL